MFQCFKGHQFSNCNKSFVLAFLKSVINDAKIVMMNKKPKDCLYDVKSDCIMGEMTATLVQHKYNKSGCVAIEKRCSLFIQPMKNKLTEAVFFIK